ncbi:hypothetical protein [Holospora curviuscula]|uniref:Uncharacterized protein n=1 Tax=Holospora curviuscula TaxID=1082868 RepID=A0A2S5R776_9PROT|nr:hypothetical protein [Holospora curviuscula]PPE03186.1 hypothetical protein HCUR_01386 [Holospora curviuscula]
MNKINTFFLCILTLGIQNSILYANPSGIIDLLSQLLEEKIPKDQSQTVGMEIKEKIKSSLTGIKESPDINLEKLEKKVKSLLQEVKLESISAQELKEKIKSLLQDQDLKESTPTPEDASKLEKPKTLEAIIEEIYRLKAENQLAKVQLQTETDTIKKLLDPIKKQVAKENLPNLESKIKHTINEAVDEQIERLKEKLTSEDIDTVEAQDTSKFQDPLSKSMFSKLKTKIEEDQRKLDQQFDSLT